MKCPNCNAEVGNNKFCEYCGSKITVDMQREQEQLNKQGCPRCGSTNISFSREKHAEIRAKSRTSVVRNTVGYCKDCGYTWNVSGSETGKKRNTLLWVLGWLFCFPIPVMILIWRKKNTWDIKVKIAVTIAFWVLFFAFYGTRGSSSSSTASSSSGSNTSSTASTELTEVKTETADNSTKEPVAEQPSQETRTEVAETTPEPEIEYMEVSVQEMISDLEANALRAQEKYKNQYLEVTGYLSTIDSSGKYISLEPDEYSFIGVLCYVKNDTQRAQVASMSVGDTVTLRGKCTNVGEVMGFSLDIDSIDGYEDGTDLDLEVSDDGYIVVSANEMSEIITENALKAQLAFKGKNVEVSGKLGSIDSNGSYITIDTDNEWDFTNIQCFIKNSDQKNQIMDMSTGDRITVRGKCKDVGEVLGYSIDIESIE